MARKGDRQVQDEMLGNENEGRARKGDKAVEDK